MAAVIPQQQQQQQQPKSSWRGFSTTSQNTIKTEFPDRIVGPSVWDGKALEQKPEEWIYHVTAEDIADIERGLQHFKASGVDLVDLSAKDFPLTTFKAVLDNNKKELFSGRGFTLIRGFPILNYSREDQVAIFMGVGAYLGTRKVQNGKGHVLGHVKDLTYGSTTKSVYDADEPTTRIYATRKAQPFHVDGTDVVALLCLNEGHEGGLSSVISSHTVYNRLQELRPDIVELLKEPWLWDRKGEHGPDEAPYISASPLTYYKDHLFTFWGPHFFETMTRFKDVTIDPRKFEAMKYIQELCEREALNMQLKVGDMQFVQNYQILHARGAYTDKPGATRHLLRLWFLVNGEEVGWEMPFGKGDYDYGYVAKKTVPLEAE